MTTETKTPCFDSAPGSVKQAVTGVAGDISTVLQEVLRLSPQDCEPNMPALREAIAIFIHDSAMRNRVRNIVSAVKLANMAIDQAKGRTH